WATLFFTNDRGFRRIGFVLRHTSIQFVLPVAILETLIRFSDHVTDRTAAPWGYLIFHSNMAGVFFPQDKPYADFVSKFWDHAPVEFEGQAYVGLAAIAGLLAIIGIQLYRLARGRFKLIFSLTDHKVLNIFFWTSILLLFISFGEPFVDGHENWLFHIGPLRQFRAIGRFNWVFFYVVNVIVVYRLFKVSQRNKFVLAATLFLIPAILLFDMYYNIKGKQDNLNNRIAELSDVQNQIPEDRWLQNFNPASYQAILPLPFFQSGSENIARLSADQEIVKQSYIVSLKTGLPVFGGVSARASLSQTAKSISLVLNPTSPAAVLNDIHDQRPFLVLVREGTLDENEERILHLSKPLANSVNYKLYSISPSTLKNIPEQRYESIRTQFDTLKKYPIGPFFSADSEAAVIYNSFDDLNGKPYLGKASLAWKLTDLCEMFNSIVNVPGNYNCSFWMNHVNEDLYPRLTIEAFSEDETGKVKPYYLLTDALKQIKAFDGNWGLVEFPLDVPAAGMRVHVRVWNKDMPKGTQFEFDEFVLRPQQTTIYRSFGDTIQMNNCFYHSWK
ncbi:MAG TPA: hypothetical protein VFJ43_15125, partial [Bacteroidia bacterium]|nr:hypothetical protein [Bacteroidia bacterium]